MYMHTALPVPMRAVCTLTGMGVTLPVRYTLCIYGVPYREGCVCAQASPNPVRHAIHSAPLPAREALLVARPPILISTTGLPTHVGRHRCTTSTLAIHCACRQWVTAQGGVRLRTCSMGRK